MMQFANVRIVASTPGYLRVEVPALYRSDVIKKQLERAAAGHPAVRSARANPLTARVLILFEPERDRALILAELGLGATDSGPGPGVMHTATAAPPPAATEKLYQPWHAREAEEALAFHGSSAQHGLSGSLAKWRLRQGSNVLPRMPPVSSLEILLNQFKSLPIILLAVSAGVSLLTGGVAEAAAISAVLVLNGTIGFQTEKRAEATVASLSELVDDSAMVLRDGAAVRIGAADVVPGDMLLLSPGTRVVADVRLAQVSGLLVDESALTGESVPVAKSTGRMHERTPLAERRNMAYRGTSVAAGSGRGVVVGTGLRTEAGGIEHLTQSTRRPKTPGQQQLDRLGGQLIKASSAMCVAIFGIGMLRGFDRLSMFKSAISLAIAAVPEGMPTVATASLARGLRRMRERHVLIRNLHAVETIGSIHTICMDKTGTLTRNVMTAVAIHTATEKVAPESLQTHDHGQPLAIKRLLQVCVLCNEAGANGERDGASVTASATESALLALARHGGQTDGLRVAYPLIATELRAEGRNFMRTFHRYRGGQLVAVKGSPDEVLGMCERYLDGHDTALLIDDVRNRILQQNQHMAGAQLRVLGFAFAENEGKDEDAGEAKGGCDSVCDLPLTWIGLVGLADPLRPGMAQMIARLHQAGIATIMLTGDQAATAYGIGKQLHLNNGGDIRIVNAEHLEDVQAEQLRHLATNVHVFSRVTPSHKLRIVQALQQVGQTVAMTGDGINDGPALRAADIGIAMGSGTDVALSVADIALKNDELDSLLDAVSQGRTISDNIRKSVHFLLSSNLSEILLVAGAVTAGMGPPLTPLQLLWLNLLTDMLPAIALAAEPAEPDVMQRPPRDAGRGIVDRSDMWRYAREGGALSVGALGAFAYGVARYGSGARAGTIAFDTLVLGQMLHAVCCRSDHHRSFFDPALPPNSQLMLAIVSSLALQAGAHLIPGLRRLLGMSSLSLSDVAVVLAGAVGPVLLNELTKRLGYKKAATSATAERSTSLSTSSLATPAATF